MKPSIATTLVLSALTLSSLTYAASASNSADAKVVSTEFQYDKPFQSLPRLELTHKQMISGVATTDTAQTSWEAKNAELQELTFSDKSRPEPTAINNNDFSIYDSWVTLDNDFDFDGYYSKFTVEFDADTVYERAYVYAIIYLGTNDVFESIHTTSVFAINGDSSNDSFVVESELVSGFPPDEYEIMVELYDADTDFLVAFSDGLDDADLAFTPLESENYEVLPEERIIIVEEHGGSLGWMILLAGFIVGLRKKLA
jgi:hypothetical protein